MKELSSRRKLRLRGQEILTTPTVVPSFSSRAVAHLDNAIELMSEFLHQSVLVSAYDVCHHAVPANLAVADVVILDSGGYEIGPEYLSDSPYREIAGDLPWSPLAYREVLDRWSSPVPTFAVSWDAPTLRVPLPDQLSAANDLFGRYPHLGRIFLAKPTSHKRAFLDVDEIIQHAHEFRRFDVLGLTEKELGGNIKDRLVHLAQIRSALQKVDVDIPIHVFGCLDPVVTPLFVLAGADIFDGLSWIRYAFTRDTAVYLQSAAVLDGHNARSEAQLEARVWMNNLVQLERLQQRVTKLAISRDLTADWSHGEKMRELMEAVEHRLMEGTHNGR